MAKTFGQRPVLSTVPAKILSLAAAALIPLYLAGAKQKKHH
jgi:hypothetical protein